MTLARTKLMTAEAILVCGTVGLVAIFFFTPSSVLESIDYVLFYRPNIQFLRDAARELRVPLWNPYIGLGRPFLADMQTAVFYPPTYLLVFGGTFGLFLFLWLHSLLAAGGMFALGGALGMSRPLSCLMAFAYLSCPGFMGRLFSGQIFFGCGLCYLPLLFLLAVKLGDSWSLRTSGLFGLALAAQFLCGHPQVSWCSGLALGIFIFVRAIGSPPKSWIWTPLKRLGQFAISVLWCAGLVAVVLLPFFELVGQGNRPPGSKSLAAFGAMRWLDFSFVVADPGYSASWEQNIFLGLPAALVGIAGLFARERTIRSLWAVVALSVFISAGPNSPLFDVFCQWLPGYAGFRLHSRMAFMICLALLISGGIWICKVQARLLSIAQANFHLPQHLLFAGLAFLLLVPMWLEDLRIKRHSLSRIMGVSPGFPYQWKVMQTLQREKLLADDQPPPLISVNQMLFPANFAMIHHIATFDAYTSLFLKRPWDYLHEMPDLPDPGVFNTTLATQVYTRTFPYRHLPIVAGFDPAPQTLMVNPQIPPRAFIVYAAKNAMTREQILSALANGHDIYQSALVEHTVSAPAPAADASESKVRFLRYDCNAAILEVEAKTNALLILTEAWYPGWKASIGSQTQDAFRQRLDARLSGARRQPPRHHVLPTKLFAFGSRGLPFVPRCLGTLMVYSQATAPRLTLSIFFSLPQHNLPNIIAPL